MGCETLTLERRKATLARKRNITYADAGVSIEANARWVDALRHTMTSTYGPRVLNRHGAFAGCFRLDYDEELFRRNYRQPLLVGCADGVGTKVLLGIATGQVSGLGIDLVAMNVNDLITVGAEPLFFLDYLAVNHIDPAALLKIVEGIAAGCRQAGCALLGGETAEMPDLYDGDHFDLAGFAVGVVELPRLIDPQRVEVGDVLIGLPSSGIHSNGYSLVRKLIGQRRLDQPVKSLGTTLAEALLTPTRIYVRSVLAVLHHYRVKRVVNGMAHITGGGLPENVARLLPPDCDAVIDRSSYPVPPIFDFLAAQGVDETEMYRVFNMGIGFVLAVRPSFVQSVCRILKRQNESPIVIGQIALGKGQVKLQ